MEHKNRKETEKLVRGLSSEEVTAFDLLKLHQPAGQQWSQGRSGHWLCPEQQLLRFAHIPTVCMMEHEGSSAETSLGCLLLICLFLAWYQVHLSSCPSCWWLSHLGEQREHYHSPWEELQEKKSSAKLSVLLVSHCRVLSTCSFWLSFLTRTQLRILPRSGAGDGDKGEGKGGELFMTLLMSWKYMMAVTLSEILYG